ncbi:pentatricopeptide repeat-containing protein At1g31790-like [Prosopis cineraria]|uniref:pentatricopeptide repeat-containing protein At1g31790-like n=1 Tax=Prosopis cineraria TaxID=364024 RepID=UPI00240F4E7E|nr:pentatricopeptide repeat-containing protein At1g31790-like [Prosopis cineraria]
MVSLPSKSPCTEFVTPHINNHPLQLQLLRPTQNLPQISSESVQLLRSQPNPSNGLCLRKKKTKEKEFIPARSTTSDVLRLMDGLGFSVSIDIYVSLIEECTVSGDPRTAMELHAHIIRSGIDPPLSFLNRLLLMFASCGLVERARNLFDKMSVRDINSWATLLVAYFDDADYEGAIYLFLNMLDRVSISELPNWVMVCLLKACDYSMNLDLGKQVHGWLVKLDISDDVLLTCSLIRFYGKFKCLEDANIAFNKVARHNTFSWTAKIVNDCREMHFCEVLNDFKKMGRQGIRKNSFTVSSVLKASGRMPSHEHCGEQAHASAIKLGLVSDAYVECGLIDMYGRTGLVREAKLVFEMIHNRTNVACWNAMLMGYMQNGRHIEAIKLLYHMKAVGLQPQESLLKELRIACGGCKEVEFT